MECDLKTKFGLAPAGRPSGLLPPGAGGRLSSGCRVFRLNEVLRGAPRVPGVEPYRAFCEMLWQKQGEESGAAAGLPDGASLYCLPFDLEKLERELGVEVLETSFGPRRPADVYPVYGATEITCIPQKGIDRVRFFLEEEAGESMKRFTEAHMFGHFLFGDWHSVEPDGYSYVFSMYETAYTLSPANTDPMERRCNDFAKELLVPSAALESMLKMNLPLDRICEEFDAPYEALLEQAAAAGHKGLCGFKGPDAGAGGIPGHDEWGEEYWPE